MAKTITITVEDNILGALIDYAYDMKMDYEDESDQPDWGNLHDQLSQFKD